jgi:hypothetical protein
MRWNKEEEGNRRCVDVGVVIVGVGGVVLVVISVASLMILLLLFLQKQSLAFAVYLFGIGTLHTGPGLKKKHM